MEYLGKRASVDEPLHLSVILESNGLDDALWALRACRDTDRDARLYAVWCARQVQHLMTDPRSIQALDVAERYADGEAAEKELDDARRAAADAARWASALGDDADVTAAAVDVTAAVTADAARWASGASACWASARIKQTARFKQMLDDGGFVGSTGTTP